MSGSIAGATPREVYGHLCVHYAIRCLMHSTATNFGHDSDRKMSVFQIKHSQRIAVNGIGAEEHTVDGESV